MQVSRAYTQAPGAKGGEIGISNSPVPLDVPKPSRLSGAWHGCGPGAAPPTPQRSMRQSAVPVPDTSSLPGATPLPMSGGATVGVGVSVTVGVTVTVRVAEAVAVTV